MRSFQEKLLEQFEAIATEEGCELVRQARYANTGQLLAQPIDGFTTVAYLSYYIDDRQSTVEFNGNGLSPRDTSALFAATDIGKINAMFAKWRQLVGDGKAAGKPVEEPAWLAR